MFKMLLTFNMFYIWDCFKTRVSNAPCIVLTHGKYLFGTIENELQTIKKNLLKS